MGTRRLWPETLLRRQWWLRVHFIRTSEHMVTDTIRNPWERNKLFGNKANRFELIKRWFITTISNNRHNLKGSMPTSMETLFLSSTHEIINHPILPIKHLQVSHLPQTPQRDDKNNPLPTIMDRTLTPCLQYHISIWGIHFDWYLFRMEMWNWVHS